MELARRTWTAVRDDPPAVALVPVGSVEQHGPHAPLGTDLIIAEAVAERAVAALASPAVVTPAIPVGIAAEHRQFAGSLWVSPDTFRAYVRETVESLASHGIEVIILVNGHGGNIAALDEVAAERTRTGRAHVTAITWFDCLEDPPVPMGHGGPRETAALLAIDPDLVDLTRLEAAASAGSERWGEYVGKTNVAVDVDTFSDNGVVGDPRDATAADGEAMLAAAGEHIAAVASTLLERADHSA